MRWESLVVWMRKHEGRPWVLTGFAGPTPTALEKVTWQKDDQPGYQNSQISTQSWTHWVHFINELGAEGWHFRKDEWVGPSVTLYFERSTAD